jgi:hypothetical protein
VVVGEECEAALIEQLEQDEPGRRGALRRRGGQDERIRLVDPRGRGLLEPEMKEREGIHPGLALGKAADRVFVAHRGDLPRAIAICFPGRHFFSST